MFLDRCTDELNISFDFCTFTLSHTHQMKHASNACYRLYHMSS